LRELCEIGLLERYGPGRRRKRRRGWRRPGSGSSTKLAHLPDGLRGLLPHHLGFVRFSISRGIRPAPADQRAGHRQLCLEIEPRLPLEYDLLLNAFLTPTAAKAPDIDIDFCQERREEVIAYVREKYGEESWPRSAPIRTMAAKAAIKDVGRVMDIPLERVIRLTAHDPRRPQHHPGMRPWCRARTSRRNIRATPTSASLIDMARKLEGTNRNAARMPRASSSPTGRSPITSPCSACFARAMKSGGRGSEPVITTQWVMGDLEKVGMLQDGLSRPAHPDRG